MTAPRASAPAGAGISLVIPSWNGRQLLERFLPGLLRAAEAYRVGRAQPVEILVADDGSDDDTAAWLERTYPAIRLERNQPRQGFAATANRGLGAARHRLVYLLNNDVALGPDTLAPLVEHFRDPQVFAATSQVYDLSSGVLSGAGQEGEFRRGFLGVHRRYFAPGPPAEAGTWPTLFASGGSSLFDREKFLNLGGFDELLAPFGWEDVELSLRAWRRGWRVEYEPRSAVWHDFSSTIGVQVPACERRRVYERNRLLTHWIHLDTPWQWSRHGLFLALKLVGQPWRGGWEVWPAFLESLGRRSAVWSRRAQLRQQSERPLTEVLDQVRNRPAGGRELTRATAPIKPPPPDIVESGGEPGGTSPGSTDR